MELDHVIISSYFLVISFSADSRRDIVSYKPKYVHEVLVYPLVKCAHEKSV